MAKGHYVTQGGKVFKVTTPDVKRLLKAVIKGEGVTLTPEKEIGPFVDLGTITPSEASAKFMEIELASGAE